MPHGIAQAYQGVAPQNIITAVQRASARTGVDFSYLMEQAAAESSFNPTAKATTSSATGLYQFIDNTWLQMVKKHGAKYGLGHYAGNITVEGNGKASVSDPVQARRILALRNNPRIAALMAAEFAGENRAYLETHYQGKTGKTELYLAHFLGARGAADFLNAMQDNPDQSGRDVAPAAARANKNVFYNPANDRPRNMKQIYAFFDKKFESVAPTPQIQLATANAQAPITNPAPQPPAPQDTPPHIADDMNIFAQFIAPATPKSFRRLDPLAILIMAELNNSIDDILLSGDKDHKGFEI